MLDPVPNFTTPFGGTADSCFLQVRSYRIKLPMVKKFWRTFANSSDKGSVIFGEWKFCFIMKGKRGTQNVVPQNPEFGRALNSPLCE